MSDYLHMAVLFAVFALACVGEALSPARPAVADDRRLLVNFGLGVAVMLTALLPWIGPVSAAVFAGRAGWGLLNSAWLPAFPVIAEWLLALVTFSLASYAMHRLMHASPLLWRLHRLHHSDRQLDFSTGLRNHPFEAVLIALAFALPSVLLGFDPIAVTGALIALQALDLAAHSNMVLAPWVERVVGTIFVTPAMHSRHHSTRRCEHDSNFSNGLIIWDRLFGTYSGIEAPQHVGLEPDPATHRRSE